MKRCPSLGGDWTLSEVIFDRPSLERQIKELEDKSSASDFWDDPDSANKLFKKLTRLKNILAPFNELSKTLKDIERHLGHAVRVSAVLPTFYDARTRLAREAYQTLKEHFRNRCLDPIRHNTRLAEAPANRKTIFEYAPDSHGAGPMRVNTAR
jgi:hypothetical protein